MTSPERATGTFRVKRGLAEMMKGGVIMDVVTAEQAKIAEDAGACAVMALERVPADIRRDGGVARMSDPEMIEGIKAAVTDPGDGQGPHRPLRRGADPRGARRRLRRRERGADAGRRDAPHRQVRVHRAVRVRRHQPRRGAAAHQRGRVHDPLQGRGRHRQHRRGRAPPAQHHRRHAQASRQADSAELFEWAKRLQAPLPLVQEIAETGWLPVPLFCAGGIATPADAALGHAARRRGRVRRLRHLQERRSVAAGQGDRRGDDALP